MEPRQATCVELAGRGLMIEGPPGSGKSSLALTLIDRGGKLVGDDSLLLERRDNRVIVRPHPNTRGKLELRNLGLLDFPVVEETELALSVVLDEQAMRFIEAPEWLEIVGVKVPLLRLWPGSPVLHLRAEMALQSYGLPRSG